MAQLEIRNLHVALEDGTEIVKGVDLEVDLGQKHAIMGPNGSGKSTLAYALMGHPAYQVTQGQILFDGENLTELGADERAQRGLFLAFQYPHAIPGVTVTSFLRSAINAQRKAANDGEDDPVRIPEFRTDLLAAMEDLKVPRELASRYLNDGFSGGEKKRVEILQMAMLKPKIAVLDETDSGLDIDALRIVANGVNKLVGPESRRRNASMSSSPPGVTGANTTSAPVIVATICHGTMLEWCSISVTSTRSPGRRVRTPHAHATRLIASLAFLVRITPSRGAPTSRATASRPAS